MPEAVGYRVEVSRNGFPDTDRDFTATYLTQTTEENQLSLAKLTPNTEFRFRITNLCGNDESAPSEVALFKIRGGGTGDPGPEQHKVVARKPADR